MRPRLKVLGPVLGASAVALATGLSGQPIQVGPEFPVNTYTTSSQTFPAAAMDSHGNFVVVWQSYNQLDKNDVFGQRFDSSGAKVGPEFPVNSYTTGDQSHPSVAMDVNGNFVVVWQSYGQVASGDVFGQRFDSAGVAQGGEFRVNSYTTNSQVRPTVGMDAAGNFVVAWTSYGQVVPGFDGDVYGQRYSASGVANGSEFPVNSYTTGLQRAAAVAMNDAGRFVVTWADYSGSQRAIEAQRFDSSGTTFGSQFQVDNGSTTQNPLIPRVTIDAGDNVTMVWMSYLTPFGTGILGQRFDSASARVGPQFQANSYTSGFAAYPTVAAAAGGRFIVTWQNSPNGSDDVFGRMYDRSAASLGAEFPINTYTTNSQGAVALAARGSDRFVVSWMSYGQVASGSSDVFAQRLLATSNFYTVTPCRVLDTRNPAGPFGGPALAAGMTRTFGLGGQCGIPLGAAGVSLNVTVTQPTAAGDLRIFPGSSPLPLVSTINYRAGQTRANDAVVALGIGGDMTVRVDQAGGSVQFIADVNGYFQ